MTWAQRLARVFKIDVTACERCGGAVKIIACIENPTVTAKILDHLQRQGSPELTLPPARERRGGCAGKLGRLQRLVSVG